MRRITLRHPLVLISFALSGIFLLLSRFGHHSVSSSASTAYREFQQRFPFVPSRSTSSSRLLSPPEAFKEKDGLLYLQDKARPGANEMFKVQHPISYLIDKAKREWREKLDSQSKTISQASLTYRRKYGRPPPKGFDKWFEWARDNSVILLDDYDQIHRDILPFLGLPGEVIRQRNNLIITDPENYYHQGSFTIWIKDGRIDRVTGGENQHTRVQEQTSLLKRFVRFLPDMNVTIWAHDTPVMHLSVLSRDRWDDWGDPPEYVGWEAFCLPDSTMRNSIAGIHQPTIPEPSFISSHYSATDFCLHPSNLPLHSLTGNYGVGPRAVNLWPLFSHSKMTLYADLLITPLEQYDSEVGEDPDWDKKKFDRVLWRGSSTGSRYDRATIWRSSQRVRVALLANSKNENIQKTLYTISPTDNTTLIAQTASITEANKALDVLFTGEPLQCDVGDGTCEAMKRTLPFTDELMSVEDANEYKYILDVDGNGWSGRFYRLLSSKSAIIKSTGFVEWYNDRIVPWVHYVPSKLDYSDLHSIAAFFTNPANDKFGKEIGLAGKEFAEKHWRMQDMEAYMFRLYLEFARIQNREEGDLGAWDYKDQ